MKAKLVFPRHGICPSCGKDLICKKCDYTEPPIWLQSRHDFESEVALVDDVMEKMPELWNELLAFGMEFNREYVYVRGAYVYKLNKKMRNKVQRIVRLPHTIYAVRGKTFRRPEHYTERRASDKKTRKGYLSAHRIQKKT